MTTIGIKEFVSMIQGAARKVKEEQALLSRLDAAIGDGDHGITMYRAMSLSEKALAEDKGTDFQGLLHNLGWTLLGIDGGSTGPLLGTWFLGMSESVGDGQVLDVRGLAAVFEAGLTSVMKQTKAQVGDKTMIDAFLPAVEALKAGAAANREIEATLRAAATAAHEGALSTKNFVARFGKAKFAGERTVGHQDPGATSISLMFQGFVEGLVGIRTA
ncbi:MAG: dihydroxyacetone kinase subunit DhaL [Terriglobia bacterium]